MQTYKYQEAIKGDTLYIPVLTIYSPNFTESYLLDPVINFQIRNPKGELILTANPLDIQAEIGQRTFNIKDEDGVPIPTSCWYLKISILIPYINMNIPAGKYYYDIQVTYNNGVRKSYKKTELIILQDATV